MKKFFILFCAGLVSLEAYGQMDEIDSLTLLLANDRQDTVRVAHLNTLARFLYSQDPARSTALSRKALELSDSLDWNKGMANSLIWLGWTSYLEGNYPKALEYDLRALKLGELSGNRKVISAAYGSIGNIYSIQREYPKALDNFLKALKIDEEMGNPTGIARHYVNIGIVYDELKDFDKALDYYQKAFKLNEKVEDKTGMAAALSNIGSVYEERAERVGEAGKRNSFLRLALEHFSKALTLAEELENRNGIGTAYANIGSVYLGMNDYKKAEKYLLQALEISRETGAMENEKQNEDLLSDLYTRSGRFKDALVHYKRAITLNDSLFSEEKSREITRKEMMYEFEKREAAAAAEADKRAAVAAAERKRQNVVLALVSCVLLLVIVFAAFIFRALRTTRTQKRLIEKQKHLVEEKQKEILDSIYYARRIQTALLPTERYIGKSLGRLMIKREG